jgi:hypothetical protein
LYEANVGVLLVVPSFRGGKGKARSLAVGFLATGSFSFFFLGAPAHLGIGKPPPRELNLSIKIGFLSFSSRDSVFCFLNISSLLGSAFGFALAALFWSLAAASHSKLNDGCTPPPLPPTPAARSPGKDGGIRGGGNWFILMAKGLKLVMEFMEFMECKVFVLLRLLSIPKGLPFLIIMLGCVKRAAAAVGGAVCVWGGAAMLEGTSLYYIYDIRTLYFVSISGSFFSFFSSDLTDLLCINSLQSPWYIICSSVVSFPFPLVSEKVHGHEFTRNTMQREYY